MLFLGATLVLFVLGVFGFVCAARILSTLSIFYEFSHNMYTLVSVQSVRISSIL